MMTDHVKAEDFDPPLSGKQVEQVQEVINEALRRRMVEERDKTEFPRVEGDITHYSPEVLYDSSNDTFVAAGLEYKHKAVDLQPKEWKFYSVGEAVEVLKRGDWVPGRITSKDAGVINVDTEYGPVSIASYKLLRKVAS